MDTFQSEGFAHRTARIGDVEVRVSSYALGKRYAAQVENGDGGVIGRGTGASREAAETAAIASATARLGLITAADSFRRSMDHLGGRKEP